MALKRQRRKRNGTASAEVRHPFIRTAVGNGTAFFLTLRDGTPVDGRNVIGRRFRELYFDICADLGGEDELSTLERQHVRHAACLAVNVELMTSRMVAEQLGEDEFDLLQSLINSHRRVASALGLKRRQRDVTPKLADVIQGRASEVLQ